MSRFIDLTGQRFGRLVALEHFRKDGRTYWHCRCDCGNETDVEAYNLKKITRSCGCLFAELKGKSRMKTDLVGARFGRLVVVKRISTVGERQVKYFCQCDCGRTTICAKANLERGKTKSCGCLRQEGLSHKTHGCSKTKLYYVYKGIKSRCYNPKANRYSRYGGRGIGIDDEQWRTSFEAFLDWSLANGYEEGKTIDRIDNNRGYSPENCRWVDAKTQANNRATNHHITIEGKTRTIAQWAKETGVNQQLISSRMRKNGWSAEEAVITPVVDRSHNITFNGKTQSFAAWARELNIKPSTLYNRIRSGWSVEEAFTTPVEKRFRHKP